MVLRGSALQFALDMRRTRAVYRIIAPRRGGLVDESPDPIMQETGMALSWPKSLLGSLLPACIRVHNWTAYRPFHQPCRRQCRDVYLTGHISHERAFHRVCIFYSAIAYEKLCQKP